MKNQKGFTITEIVIAISVSAILSSVLFMVTFRFYSNALQAQITTEMALESQTILTQMVEDIRLADSINTTNVITDANSPTGGWVTSDPSNIIIIANPAKNSSQDIIYNSSTSLPYKNEFIYFISGGKMYKRILKNTSATGNLATTTCPQIAVTAICPPDKFFSDKINNLTFTFYDINDATTASASSARSVLLTVNMTKTVFGKVITLANSTRVTLRNQ